MVAIVTGVYLRHSLAVIRDLGEAGIEVIAVSRKGDGIPMGFYSKWVHATHLLSEENFLKELYSICNDVRVGYGCKPALMVCDRKTLRLLAEGDAISCFKGVVGYEGSPIEVLDQLGNKIDSEELCRELGIAVPKQVILRHDDVDFSCIAEVGYPCFVKASDGEKHGLFAADRVKRAETAADVERIAREMFAVTHEDVVVQEFLPGDLVNYNILASEGKVVAHTAGKTIRTYPYDGGVPVCTQYYENEELLALSARIIESCAYSGLFCIQFKQDRNGVFKFLEINPRMYGDYDMDRHCGNGFSMRWFAHLWDKVNPTEVCNIPVTSLKPGARSYAVPADFISAFSHAVHGEPTHLFDSAKNVFSSSAHARGIDLRDLRPLVAVFMSLLDRHLIRKRG